MALTNYTDLKAGIGKYLKREGDADLALYIPDFIELCESRLNTKLRLLQMEQESTTDYGAASSRFIAFPGNHIETLDLRIKKTNDEDTQYEEIKYIAPQLIHTRYSDTPGQPSNYTIRDQIELNQKADQAYKIRVHYLKKWDLATDGTNWLMTNHPDLYLYGSLVHAEPYMVNDERIATWKGLFEEALQDVDDKDQRSRDDEELATDEVMRMSTSRHGYDIESDSYR